MSVLEIVVASLLSLVTPDRMSALAASVIGRPDLGHFLRVTAKIEGRGGNPGLHPGDARHSAGMHAAAVAAGWLHPHRCPAHRDPEAGWSPRGPWGVAPAYTTRHFGPLGCYLPPAAHDVVVVAALAAALHAVHCGRTRRTRDHRQLRLCWAGAHKDPAAVLARWDAAAAKVRRR